MKIFVTGDNHFGLQYDNHSKRDVIIEERLKSLSRMVEKANEEKCELFVVTGDLFDNNDVDIDLLTDISQRLSEFSGKVAILPGNHDFYTLDERSWQNFPLGDRMILLKEYRPYPIKLINGETVILYPAFCDRKHSSENRIGWIKELLSEGDYHIGVAHGAVSGQTPDKEERYFMMTVEELSSSSVDIWLIGHTHVPFPRDLTEDFERRSERIFNAGSHVQTDVSNDTDGECFIIEIDNNKSIYAKKFCPSKLRFYRIKEPIKISPNKFEKILTQELSKYDDMSEVEITLKGVATDEELARKSEILNNVGKRFLDFKHHEGELVRFIDDKQITDVFPEMDVSAKLLLELLKENDPVAVKEVYDILVGLKGER